MSTQAEQPPDIGFARPRPARTTSDEPFRESLADLARQLANRRPFEPPPELDPKVADRLPPEPSDPARRIRRHRPWLGMLALALGFGIAAIIRALPGPPTDLGPAQRSAAAVAPPPAASTADAGPTLSATELASPQPLKLDPPPPPPPVAPIVIAVPEPTAAPAPPKAKLEGYEVMEVQTRLKAIGLNPGPLDGVVGGQTTSAIKDYEASRGKPPTGKADGALLQQLREERGRK